MEMKLAGSPLQMHGKEQPHQAQVMIAMQMADKNPIDLMYRNLIF